MSDSKSVSVPKSFVADFETVADFYGLKELGEYDIAKAAVKRDTQAAIVTFSRLAEAVRAGAA